MKVKAVKDSRLSTQVTTKDGLIMAVTIPEGAMKDAAASALYALAQAVARHFEDTDAPLGEQARAALALAEGSELERDAEIQNVR